MGFYYEKLIRPILFRQDPEKAHDLGVLTLDYLGRLGGLCRLMEWYNRPSYAEPIELFGVTFPNAVGLAAGMDKNARFWRAAPALGFGHVEIGTVTRHRQPGNDRPRVFRYPEHNAIINRMGFNNDGAEIIAKRLKKDSAHKKRRIPLGINIGKSKVTPLEQAVEDYLFSFNTLVEYADYITVNVSSPNTPDLRKLQDKAHLEQLLGELCRANRNRARKLGEKPKPMLLKIAPDLSWRQIDEILSVVYDLQLDGLIATNTTIQRGAPLNSLEQSGGLSGEPLHRRSCDVINYISRSTAGKLPLIGVGGVFDPESAGRMVDNGAHLVQIYTGMVYRGPFLARELAHALAPKQRVWL